MHVSLTVVPLHLIFTDYDKGTDTCNRTPRSHVIKLPQYCTVQSTGQKVLDVGKCSDGPCSPSLSFNHSCGGDEDCCCGPKGGDYLEAVTIGCAERPPLVNRLMEFYRIRECGCSPCLKRKTVIEGQWYFVMIKSSFLAV